MKRTRWFYGLLLLALIVPSAARATGSASVPYTIAAQSGPNLSASLLDSNWTALVNYINAREITSGTLAARPAAGTSGRWYTATDQNGGTTYFDNGSSWVTIGAAVSSTAGYAVRGLNGATSSATNTTYNVTADGVLLRNPSTGDTVFQRATVSRSNSILTAGPAADGRDVAAVFSPPAWIHLYYIWNGSTLSTLSSACAPSDVNGACSASTGPTLPTGYTHWAYIGAVRMATTGTINATFARDGKMMYATRATPIVAVSVTTSEATITLVNFIPPNALSYHLGCGGATVADLSFGPITTQYSVKLAGGANTKAAFAVELPNVSQQVFFLGGAASSNITCDVMSYAVPNGG